MWCNSCQHGHVPVMRFIKDLGREVSVCPCCGAELHEDVISSKGEQILEIAKRMGVSITVNGPEQKGFTIGKKGDDIEKSPEPVITKDNVIEKLVPGLILDPVEPTITAEPKAKPVTKKKTKK